MIEYASVEELSEDFQATMLSVLKDDNAEYKLKGLYKYLDTFNLSWNIIEPLE